MSCAKVNIIHSANLSLTVSYVTKIAFTISGKLYRVAHLKAARFIHIRTAVLNLGSMGRFQEVRELR
jgi:hypothetical protein